MFQNEKRYKLLLPISYMILIGSELLLKQEDVLYHQQLWQLPLFFILISLYLIEPRDLKGNLFLWSVMAIIEGVLWIKFDEYYSLLLPALLLKGNSYVSMKWISLMTGLGLLFCKNVQLYGLGMICLDMIYGYEEMVMRKYYQITKQFLKKENDLQSTLEVKEHLHKNEIEKFALQFENKRLEEKNQLAQALHDRLGHSINGSIFQLEACKLVVEIRPEEAKQKLQVIIDHLRESMDEIRLILREEKPKVSERNTVKLKSVCKDFETNYGISVVLEIVGKSEQINELLWKIIFECICEAFSNALKYARCDCIEVRLMIFNQVVHLEINDNGKGCKKIQEGMGISGIKERVGAVGGSVNIVSEAGFMVNILIPLNGIG